MIIAATNNPSIEPKTTPINPTASDPEIINPKPGSKMLVPLPAMAPTKPQSKAPDAADISIKRKFDTINPPCRNSANFLLLQFINNRIGKVRRLRRAAQVFCNRRAFGENFKHRFFGSLSRIAFAEMFEHQNR